MLCYFFELVVFLDIHVLRWVLWCSVWRGISSGEWGVYIRTEPLCLIVLVMQRAHIKSMF